MKQHRRIVIGAFALLAVMALSVLLVPAKKTEKTITSFEECAAKGYPIMESYPRQCRAGDRTFVETISENNSEVVVDAPVPNTTVRSPLVVNGKALGTWYFEANLPIAILDSNGKELGRVGAQAQGEWMTTSSVPFRGEITFEKPWTLTGILRIMNDNPSGLPENEKYFDVPIRFNPLAGDLPNVTDFKVYFGNSIKNPGAEDCRVVYGVERSVPETQAVARAALEELLRGVSEKEKAQGYFTSVNPGVTIQKLTIENGVAKVDFDETLERAVGGSCRVAAISAQITKTLLQFPTVRSVVISINGRTEDILQP